MDQPISVLIVDDHQVVRKGVRAFLEARPEFMVVGEAASGSQAEELVEDSIPDVVLLDLIMPEMDGIEATRRIKNLSPRTQIVILTSYHDDEHIFPALEAGAISYVLKDIDMDELGAAIAKAAHGEATLHPQVASRIIQEMHMIKDEDVNPFKELTPREMEILKLIAEGMNNQDIAQQLVISEHTVKGHVSNILSKLHLADRTQAAVFAWKKGVIRRS